MFDTANERITGPTFNRAALRLISEELAKRGFTMESVLPDRATYRNGDRYLAFTLLNGEMHVVLGIGYAESTTDHANSITLDAMVHFLYGSLRRGVHKIGPLGILECSGKVIADLKEFANEFLQGDFRPFLRVLALKYKDEHGMLRENIIVGSNRPAGTK